MPDNDYLFDDYSYKADSSIYTQPGRHEPTLPDDETKGFKKASKKRAEDSLKELKALEAELDFELGSVVSNNVDEYSKQSDKFTDFALSSVFRQGKVARMDTLVSDAGRMFPSLDKKATTEMMRKYRDVAIKAESFFQNGGVPDVSKEDEPMFLYLLNEYSRKQGSKIDMKGKGYFDKATVAFLQSSLRAGVNAKSFLMSAPAKITQIPGLEKILPMPSEMVGDSKEPALEYERRATLYSEAASIALQHVKPESAKTWKEAMAEGSILDLLGTTVEKGSLGAMEQVPNLAMATAATAAGGPSAGVAYWTAQMEPDVRVSLKKRGIDPKYSRNIALPAAILMGAVENLQVKGLTRGLMESASKVAHRKMSSALLSIAKREGREITEQLVQENLQEIISFGAEALGADLDKNVKGFNSKDWEKIGPRAIDTTLQTMLITPFLRAPGAISQGASDIRGVQAPSKGVVGPDPTFLSKDTLLSPEGPKMFTQNYPEKAERIAKAKEPSRKVFKEVFGKDTRFSKKDRQQIHAMLQLEQEIKEATIPLVRERIANDQELAEGRISLESEQARMQEADLTAEELIAEASDEEILQIEREVELEQELPPVEQQVVEEEELADVPPPEEVKIEEQPIEPAKPKKVSASDQARQLSEESPSGEAFRYIKKARIKDDGSGEYKQFMSQEKNRKQFKQTKDKEGMSPDQIVKEIAGFDDASGQLAQKMQDDGAQPMEIIEALVEAHREHYHDKGKKALKQDDELFALSADQEYDKAKNQAKNILRTFVPVAGPKTKGQIAQNSAINEANKVSEMIDDGSITPKDAEKRLSKAMNDAEAFAKKEVKPAQQQEETLFDVTPEDELNLGGPSLQVSKDKITGGVLKETFPGAKVEKAEDGRWNVSLEGGANFEVLITDDIPVDVESIMKDYKVTRAEARKLAAQGASGATLSPNTALKLSDGTVITSKDVVVLLDKAKADKGTSRHEALHVAKELGFFEGKYGEGLWNSMILEYGTEEGIAAARELWEGQDGLWSKIVQFFHRIMGKLGLEWNPDAAMNETFSKEFWAQGAKENLKEGDVKYQIENDDVTSIKNDVVNDLRERRGEGELEGAEAKTKQQWLDDAADAIRRDYSVGARLVSELSVNPRILSDLETAILQIHYRREYNVFNNISDALFKATNSAEIASLNDQAEVQMRNLVVIEDATKSAGREWGRAGVARQIALANDFSLETMERKHRVNNGGKMLSKEQHADVKRLHEKINRLERRVKEESEKVKDLKRQEILQEQLQSDSKAVKRKVSSRARKVVNKTADILKNLGFKLKKKGPGDGVKFQLVDEETSEGNEAVIEELYEAAKEMADAYREQGISSASSFISVVRSEFGEGVSEAEYTFKKAWQDSAPSESAAQAERVELEEGDVRGITREARAIQRELVEAGVTNQNDIIDAVHEALQESFPDMSRSEAIDALSAYGQFTTPSSDDVDVAVRELNAKHLQLSKHLVLEEAIRKAEEWREEGLTDDEIAERLVDEGLRLKATGFVRDTPTDIVRHMIAKTNELKKELPALPEAKTGQLQSAVDAAKRSTRNRIKDLEWQIANNQKIVKDRKELKADEELTELRKKRDQLNQVYRGMFPPKGASEAQKIAAAIKATDRSIAQMQRKLDSGDITPNSKSSSKLSSPELDASRARLKQLQAEMKVLRDAAKPRMSPEERARRNYEASLLRRIADYKERIAEEDFGPRKKKDMRELSNEERVLKKRLEDTKQEFYKKGAEYKRKNMSLAGKALHYVQETGHLSRALMTSIDLSAVFRQGGIVVYGHPELAKKSAREMFKAFASKQSAFNTMEDIRNDPLYQFSQTAKLNITDDSKITRQEEAFQGLWADRIPGVAASSRAYTSFLNKLRYSLFKQMIGSVGKGGTVTLAEAKVIASYINVATGRSDLKQFNSAAATLNSVFFAPRYVASRFQYLTVTPATVLLGKNSARVKKAIALEYARTLTGAATFIGSLMALGYLVADGEDEEPSFETDPRSSDFMKIKIGETRIDPLAGLQQAIVFSSRIATGQVKSTTTEEMRELKLKKGDPYAKSRLDVVKTFFRTKLGPIPGAIATAMDDMTDVVGKKHTPLSLVGGLFVPLSIREVGDTMKAQGWKKGTAMSMLALLGMSTGTYGERTAYLSMNKAEREKQFEKDLKNAEYGDGPLAYSDKMTSDMVKEYEDAKLKSAYNKIDGMNKIKPLAGTMGKSLEERRKAWKKGMDAAVEWFKQSGLSKDEAVELYRDYLIGYEKKRRTFKRSQRKEDTGVSSRRATIRKKVNRLKSRLKKL